MSEKHLQKGDALPPFADKLRIFTMRFCPYAHKTILVLNAKRLPYDNVFINLDNKPEWLQKYSAKGTVPALEIEPGVSIFNSNVINLYLDGKYPEIPLQSNDPLRRAQDQLLAEDYFSSVSSSYYTAAFNSSAVTPDTVTAFFKGIDHLQDELKTRGKKFLHDDEPGLVDYSIWPWLERIEALPLLGQSAFALDKTKYKHLITYIEAMKQVPAVKAYILAPDTHAKFIETRAKGNAEYDMLDTSSACCMRPRKKKE